MTVIVKNFTSYPTRTTLVLISLLGFSFEIRDDNHPQLNRQWHKIEIFTTDIYIHFSFYTMAAEAPPQIQYRDLMAECQQLMSKIASIESDRNEHVLVEETLQPLDGDRRAYR